MVDQTGADSRGKTFEAATIMNAPLAKICATIQAYEEFPAYMPNTTNVAAVRYADSSAQVDFTLTLPLGKIKKYRVKMQPQMTPTLCRLSWTMLPWPEVPYEQTLEDTSGYWELTPVVGNLSKTVVRYHAYTDPGDIPFGLGWIVDSLSKDALPKMMESLRNKVR